MVRYMAQLEALEPVFPVSETEVGVPSPGVDPLNPGRRVSFAISGEDVGKLLVHGLAG